MSITPPVTPFTPGTPPTIEDIRRQFLIIVQLIDQLRTKVEDIGQWASIYDAATLCTLWADPRTGAQPTTAEAQEFIDTALAFVSMVQNSTTTDPTLGARVVKIRPIGRNI